MGFTGQGPFFLFIMCLVGMFVFPCLGFWTAIQFALRNGSLRPPWRLSFALLFAWTFIIANGACLGFMIFLVLEGVVEMLKF